MGNVVCSACRFLVFIRCLELYMKGREIMTSHGMISFVRRVCCAAEMLKGNIRASLLNNDSLLMH
jgi:hypothetical protein